MRIQLSPLHRDEKEGILLNEVFGVGKLSSYSQPATGACFCSRGSQFSRPAIRASTESRKALFNNLSALQVPYMLQVFSRPLNANLHNIDMYSCY